MSLNQETSKVYIASDHAGFALKQFLTASLMERGYSVQDMGAHELSPQDDYPDFITPCSQKVAQESMHNDTTTHTFGIVIGGSGQGEAMAANRIVGARAAVFYGEAHALTTIDENDTAPTDTLDIVRLARLHNNANILSLGARFVSKETALRVVLLFLETEFSNAPRHTRRIEKF